jgi:hypothetical protein
MYNYPDKMISSKPMYVAVGASTELELEKGRRVIKVQGYVMAMILYV